jgi:hypothetical protein
MIAACLVLSTFVDSSWADAEPPVQHWLWSKAYAIPNETARHGIANFSIAEGGNQKLYVGTAKIRANAFLVEFDPATRKSNVVIDAQQETDSTGNGYAAQAMIGTRNNVGVSGKIYLGTRQGARKPGDAADSYPGGHPLVFDPQTGKTKSYGVPVAHQGIMSIAPDESRGVAYISTCSELRDIASTHFIQLDLKTGKYVDLLDCQHMYSFVVVDWLGRAYHPIRGGEIARYDPATKKLERLKQTIDSKPAPFLDLDEPDLINWQTSPDRKTLYAVARQINQLYAFDLTAKGAVLTGRSLGPLVEGALGTNCSAMCVAGNGQVWMGVSASVDASFFARLGMAIAEGPIKKAWQMLRVVSYTPGDIAPKDLGAIAIANPDYAGVEKHEGNPVRKHDGVYSLSDGTLLPRNTVAGICAHSNGNIYITTQRPFTIHEIKIPRVAAIVTEYRHNTHADVIIGRLAQTDTLDDKGQTANIKLAGLFTDQVPSNDTSRKWSAKYGFPIYPTVEEALRAGSAGPLGVDGILMIAEHGNYERNATGSTIYPKRRLFTQIANVVEASGRKNVPIFSDKHLADNWTDAKWIYDRAKELEMPMMAGSSLPACWRYPPTDVRRGAKLKQIVGISYGSLDSYGFHGLEMLQCLVERRANGETGVKSVQTFVDDAVWKAGDDGVYDRKLLDAALARLRIKLWEKRKKTARNHRLIDLGAESAHRRQNVRKAIRTNTLGVREVVGSPVLFVVDYNDGLRACLFTLNGAVAEWAAAWRYEDDSTDSTLFSLQDARPYSHFTYLLMGAEKLMQTGIPAWPVERTLLTSGVLDAVLISKSRQGQRVPTPYLDVTYKSHFNWRQPPPRPPDRPSGSQ